MKLNKYFMMGAMGLSLVACSDNLDENGQGANGTNPNEGTTYVAFALDFKGAESRVDDGPVEGSTEESSISSAYVIMDNSVIIGTSNTDTNADAGYYDATTEKFLFHTEPGNHTFLAVVNPETIPTADNVSTYFTEAITTTPTTIAAENNFMMSSVEEKTFAIADNVTEQDALNGTSNNFEIEVERVSAKVTVTAASEDITGDAGGTISGTVFNLRQGADKTLRMGGAYIADNTYSWEQEDVEVEIAATNAYQTADPVYCLDNIQNAYTQDVTTYITLKTSFIPENVVNPTTGAIEANTENAPKTFFVVTEGDLAGNYILAVDDAGSAPDPFPEGVTALSAAYTNGECWFGPIWIGQEEPGESPTAPVIRNTWYNLEITSITLPGSPTEPKPIKDEELEPETNVAITLSVLPWNFKNVEVDL